MSNQAIHLLALIALLPCTVFSAVWFLAALWCRGAFGTTWSWVIAAGVSFVLAASALIYVLYHPHALPALLGSLPPPPPNPFKVS